MSEALDILRSYASLVTRLAGAEAVSLYVPPGAAGEREILVQVGGTPLPELASPEAAAAFHARAGGDTPGPQQGLTRLASEDAGGVLYRVPLHWFVPRDDAPGVERRKATRAPWRRACGLARLAIRDATGGRGSVRPFRRRGAPRRGLVERVPGPRRGLRRPHAGDVPPRAGPGDGTAGAARVPERAGSRDHPIPADRAAAGRARRLRLGERAARPPLGRPGAARDRARPAGGRAPAGSRRALRRRHLHRPPPRHHRSRKAGGSPRTWCAGSARDATTSGCCAWSSARASRSRDPKDPIDAHELVRRADQAVSAAKRGQAGNVRVWEKGSDVELARSLDRLQGIFTGDKSKDYRNMRLLLDTVAAVAASTDPDRPRVRLHRAALRDPAGPARARGRPIAGRRHVRAAGRAGA